MEVHKKIHYDQVQGDEWCHDEDHEAGECEARPQLLAQLSATPGPEKLLVDLAVGVKDEIQDAEFDGELDALRHVLPLAQKRKGYCQVEYVLVEESDEEVLSPHDAVAYVVCVQSLLGLTADPGTLDPCQVASRLGVRVSQRHDPGDDILPRDRLHVGLGYVEEVSVEFPKKAQLPELQDELHAADHKPNRKEPQPQVPDGAHVLSALGDGDFRQLLAVRDLAIVNALGEEGHKDNNKRGVSKKQACVSAREASGRER